jgi:hypothetical protein
MYQCGCVGYSQFPHPYYFWEFLGPPVGYPGNAYGYPYYNLSPLTDYGILASRVSPFIFVDSPFFC